MYIVYGLQTLFKSCWADVLCTRILTQNINCKSSLFGSFHINLGFKKGFLREFSNLEDTDIE